MLLSDRGFQTFEPLEQPDEHVPTIIIDEKKTFQTIMRLRGRLHRRRLGHVRQAPQGLPGGIPHGLLRSR